MELDHREDKCTFEVILDKYNLADVALKKLGRIVHGADIPEDIKIAEESAGLKAFADGLHNICTDDTVNWSYLFRYMTPSMITANIYSYMTTLIDSSGAPVVLSREGIGPSTT